MPRLPASLLRSAPLFATAAALLFAVTSASAALTRADGDNRAQFQATGPAGLAIVGKAANVVTLEETGPDLRVHVALGSLDTGIALRNRHMHEKYLETTRHPEAVLSVPRSAIRIPAEGQLAGGDADGTLTLHGRSQPIRVHYEVTTTGGAHRVTGRTTIDIRSYGVDVPKYLGVTVRPEVTVEVAFATREAS